MATATREKTRMRTRRALPEPLPDALPIGDEERTIFNCPVCARPLATGATRCPKCGTRLVLGVPAKRAGLFMAVGGVAGAMAGGLLVAVVALGSVLVRAGMVPPPATPSPSGTVHPTSSPVAATPEPPPSVPPVARSALAQAGSLHVRLASAADTLKISLEARQIDTTEIARTFRTITSTAATGSEVAGRLVVWDDAAALSVQLSSFYGELRDTARAGLAASLQNEPAYRAAAEDMLSVLAQLASLDAQARVLALAADVVLPPLDPVEGSPGF
ncbi:MAG: zinc ribbon domain-containing protein [Chloroflexota bacterium]|nr:zinc ribbon domain-containing protein [Chloroflexota bacterium]